MLTDVIRAEPSFIHVLENTEPAASQVKFTEPPSISGLVDDVTEVFDILSVGQKFMDDK